MISRPSSTSPSKSPGAWSSRHEKGLVHRDLKPHNVLMSSDGVAKVTDFGLARRGVASGFGGTPGYAAPEQWKEGKTVDQRSDVFAFGVTLWKMVGGKIGWADVQDPGRSIVAKHSVSAARKRGEPGPLPTALTDLILGCIAPDPEDRWQDLGQVCDGLKSIFSEVVGQRYSRPEPSAAELLADGLNNRAVSQWDLENREQAEGLWEEALRTEPHHPEATYNLGLIHWRSGRCTDHDFVRRMEEMRGSHEEIWRDEYLEALVHLERGDVASAGKLLEEARAAGGGESDEVRSACEAAERLDVGMGFVRTLEGHSDGVNTVAVTSDGRFAVSGSEDKTLRLWELATGKSVQIFEGHTGSVTAVAVTPDGRFAVSGSEDKKASAVGTCHGQERADLHRTCRGDSGGGDSRRPLRRLGKRGQDASAVAT